MCGKGWRETSPEGQACDTPAQPGSIQAVFQAPLKGDIPLRRKVATAEAALRSAKDDAAQRVDAAEAVAAEVSGRAEQLAEDASRLRDTVK